MSVITQQALCTVYWSISLSARH